MQYLISLHIVALISLSGLSALYAHEDAAPSHQGDDAASLRISPGKRTLAAGASVVPGLLLHGSGHFALGQRKTAYKLLGAQAIGLTMMIGGISGLAVTGAADEFVPPLYWTAMSGTGLFFFSWGADLYGTLGLSRLTGRAQRPMTLELAQGYQHIINPSIPTTSLSKTQAHLNWKRLRVQGIAYLDVRGLGDRRLELRTFYRALGRPSSGDGTQLELGVGYVNHRYDFARTTERLAEFLITGRYDLKRVAPTLSGMFVDGSVGVALGQYAYDDIDTQFEDLLLGTAGLGVSLGGDSQGYAMIFYDHRHDGYVAGAKVTGLGSGTIGSANLRILSPITQKFALELGYGVGSAHVFDASLVWRPVR